MVNAEVKDVSGNIAVSQFIGHLILWQQDRQNKNLQFHNKNMKMYNVWMKLTIIK